MRGGELCRGEEGAECGTQRMTARAAVLLEVALARISKYTFGSQFMQPLLLIEHPGAWHCHISLCTDAPNVSAPTLHSYSVPITGAECCCNGLHMRFVHLELCLTLTAICHAW